MHRRLLFTGAIQENIENKMAAGFPHAQNKTKMVVGRLTMPSAVSLIHSFVLIGELEQEHCALPSMCMAFSFLKQKKEYAAAFSG